MAKAQMYDKPLAVRSFAEHFYRAGTKFTREGGVYEAGSFTTDQVEQLRAERALEVRDVDEGKPKSK